LFYAAIKDSDRPAQDVVAMMSDPEDPRWSEEDSNSNSIFSNKIARFYTDIRSDLEGILNKIQASLERVPVSLLLFRLPYAILSSPDQPWVLPSQIDGRQIIPRYCPATRHQSQKYLYSLYLNF
jgi:hypothetical protein